MEIHGARKEGENEQPNLPGLEGRVTIAEKMLQDLEPGLARKIAEKRWGERRPLGRLRLKEN